MSGFEGVGLSKEGGNALAKRSVIINVVWRMRPGRSYTVQKQALTNPMKAGANGCFTDLAGMDETISGIQKTNSGYMITDRKKYIPSSA
jgi:hypothetical protein